MSTTNINELISEFRALQTQNAVTPENLGFILQKMQDENISNHNKLVTALASIESKANDLHDADSSLSDGISENAGEISVLKERVSTSEGKITSMEQALKPANLQDIFVQANQFGTRLLAPIVTHTWGDPAKYIGIRIDHIFNLRMLLDFQVHITMWQSNIQAQASVCYLQQPGEHKTMIVSDKATVGGIETDVVVDSYIREEDDKMWLILELCRADALMHISVEGLCCNFGIAPMTNELMGKFASYELKRFMLLPTGYPHRVGEYNPNLELDLNGNN